MAKCEVDYQIFDVANLEFGQWEKVKALVSDGTIICKRKSDIEFFGLEFTVHEWAEGVYVMDLHNTPASRWGWAIKGESEVFNLGSK